MMLPAIGGVSEPGLGTAPNRPHLPTYNPTPLTHPEGGREGAILSSLFRSDGAMFSGIVQVPWYGLEHHTIRKLLTPTLSVL